MSSIALKGFQDTVGVCMDYLMQNGCNDHTVIASMGGLKELSAGICPTVLSGVEKNLNQFSKILPEQMYTLLYNSFYILFKEVYINSKIIDEFENLLLQPLKSSGVEGIKIYIEGYLSGVGAAYFKNLSRLINNWYKEQIDNDISVLWTDYIMLSDYTDDEKSQLMVGVVKGYISANPSWLTNNY